jgi:adenosine deaminase
LVDAGALLALGADDPLLFGPRLAAQYDAARDVHGLDDAGLRHLAGSSIEASRAPDDVKKKLLAEVEAWGANRP